jgi:arabinose-5-phosphate isomerase
LIDQNKILKIARQTVNIELQALSVLETSLDDSFCRVVDLLMAIRGRVVVTGIGKSAIIAQKIVATFNSTGTPALFMHAADAIHGDLGMIKPDDLVICLSKSGESPEIKVLVPLVLRMGNQLIGITAFKDSYLGKFSHHTLLTPMDREADPYNLAPTTSTILQMAMGDALAMTLLALKGFTARDFANFHPGGALGKQLYLKVSDLCDQHEKPSVTLKDNVRAVILEITGKRLGATAVLDENGHIAGIVTDGDLRRMIAGQTDFIELTAKDIMTRNPHLIAYDDYAVNAIQIIQMHKISQLIAVQDGVYKGMVHLHDLVREGIV